MNTRLKNRKQIAGNLKNKEYRDNFVSSHIGVGLSFQIRGMRHQREWTQKNLADRADTKQEAICRLENPDYGRFTLETLRRLASAFDVALIVKFAPFSELLNKTTSFTPSDVEIDPYDKDDGLKDWANTTGNVISIDSFHGSDVRGLKVEAIASTTKSVANG